LFYSYSCGFLFLSTCKLSWKKYKKIEFSISFSRDRVSLCSWGWSGICYLAPVGLQLTILLPLLPKCWHYKCEHYTWPIIFYFIFPDWQTRSCFIYLKDISPYLNEKELLSSNSKCIICFYKFTIYIPRLVLFSSLWWSSKHLRLRTVSRLYCSL
jgi:hypothetical protein